MKYQLIKPINKNYSVIEQILTNRNIPLDQINHYLNTSDDDINNPECLGESLLKQAVIILIQTIKNNNRVLIIVDSDCDGFTSAAVLINYLHDLYPTWVENNVDYVLHQGKQHGLNDHMDYILNREYKLVIVPDAGSNDVDECTKLKQQGIDTIILDHHLCDVQNPDAIVINNQLSQYPNKNFSGVGVVWQFCRYIDKLLRVNYVDNYLDLVALGNCADMMSMTSIETKHIINKGFQNLKNPFFIYLSQKNEYSMKGKINHTSVAFYIAPYVNAICRSGTIDEKTLVFESMLKHKAFIILPSTKRGHTLGQTEQLVEQAIRIATNVKARQTKAQDAGLELLQKKIQEDNLLQQKVLLFLLEPGQIDRNIAGLIANKLMAKYQRPVCILTKTIEEKQITEPITVNFINKDSGSSVLSWEEPPFDPPYKITTTSYQGSARGCDKVGIFDFKGICAETGVTMYQTGHPGAFGLGLLENNIQDFIEKTNDILKDMPNEPIYYVDYIYNDELISSQDILDIANLQDLWGKDIDEPLLCIEHLRITPDMVTVYQKRDNTLKITLLNGISIMKFKASDEQCYKLQNPSVGWTQLNIVGKANRNEWMGNVSAQIFIEDYEILDAKQWIF